MKTSKVEDVLKRTLAEIEQATGHSTHLKENDVEALAVAVQRAMEECGEDTSNEERVLELSAHTLGVLGDDSAARRLLVFGSGLVKASVWEFTGKDPLWVLDLRKLVLNSGVQIEMAIFKSLSLVLETIADVWDDSSGKGELGLRHVLSTAEQMFGISGKRSKKRNKDFSGEVLGRCRMKLGDIAAMRGWTTVPTVIAVD